MPKLRWLWARWATRRDPVRFVYHPPNQPAGHRQIYLYESEGDYDVGLLDWQVCDQCRQAVINKISLASEFQRRGFGRRLIKRALRDGPDYTWSTSGQSPEAKKFFPALTAETGVAFPEHAEGCPHLNDNGPYQGGDEREPKAVVVRDM